MRYMWRTPLTLFVSAAYFLVVTCGHHFHDHGDERHGHGDCGGCCCAVSVDSCTASGAAAADHSAAAKSAAASPKAWHVAHVCPVCCFFSHYCASPIAAGSEVTGQLERQVPGGKRLMLPRACAGPQQPRAPPLAF